MKKKLRFTIGAKTVVIIAVLALLVVTTAMAYFSISVSNNNKQHYSEDAGRVAGTAAAVVDVNDFKALKNEVKTIVDASSTHPTSEEWGSDEWNTYTAQFDGIYALPEYTRLQTFLRRFMDNNNETESIYLVYIDIPRELFVYVVDGAPEEDACPPGCIDPIYDQNKRILEDPTIGFPAYITNTSSYGWLVTAGACIYDGDEVVGYALADISMDMVRSVQRQGIINLFIFLLVSVAIISVIGITIVHFILTKPIKQLNELATLYRENPEEAHRRFDTIKIYTNDEIAELTESVKLMENDIHLKISELMAMNEELAASQKETKRMSALANKDALTGALNKTAYNHITEKMDEDISKGRMGGFGVAMIDLNYLKSINDEYGHNAGDTALKNLYDIIASTFRQSPIFRIGGDEFVVILSRNDFEHSDLLINEFNKKIHKEINKKKAETFERTSAAIGYAVFDRSSDHSVEDVFRRADKEMYTKKRVMKGE